MANTPKGFTKGIAVQNETDRSKQLLIDVDSSASSGTSTTIKSKQTLNRTLELPNVSGELVEKDAAQILTNKTIDGDNNTVQDLSLSSLKTVLADADKFISRDVSGQVVSDKAVPVGAVVGTTDTQSLTNKTIDADLNTITNIENADIKVGAAIAATKIAAGTVDNTEFGYLDGVTSPIQTQLDAKAEISGATDNRLVRTDGATDIQQSGITVDDSNNITGVNDLTVEGNLTVNGTTTTVNTATLDVEDKNITVNYNGTDVTAEGAGITIDRTGTSGSLVYEDALASKFKAGALGSEIEIANVSSSQSLTNKNLKSNTNLLTGAKANTFERETGNQQVVTIPDVSAPDTFVTQAFSQAIINKDIDGGTASNTSRLTVPKNTLTNLLALTRKEATVVYGEDTDKLYVDDGSTLKEIGSGSGSKNFISNGDAEANTLGWATYADAAASRPVDGTGGSPSVTFTRSTSSPLEGQGSFLFTKDAVNRQGQGASYDFTIDDAYKAKVLTIEMDYVVVSGTFVAGSPSADSDIIAYIYDVTNSTLIEPSSIKLLSNSTTISDKFSATFQTSASGSQYRLILHCATTSASAYVVKFDNIKVSPSEYVYGTPVTDWQTFTPTGTWTTNSTYTGRWRRVGDSAQVQYLVTLSGAPNATPLLFDFPPGLSPDNSKIVTSNNTLLLGNGSILDAGTRIIGIGAAYNTTNIAPQLQETAGTNAITNTNPITFAVNDQVMINVTLPITGWSSSVQTSDQTSTRVVAAYASRKIPTGTIAANFNNITVFGTVDSDTHGAYNTSTGIYTCPVSGYYAVDFNNNVAHASTAINNAVGSAFDVNSTTYYPIYERVESTSVINLMSKTSGVVFMNAGDTLSFRTFSSGTTPTYSNSLGSSSFSIRRISGPSTIAANETIAVSVDGSSAVIGTSLTTITPTSELVDTHAAFVTDTFTCPASGLYEVALFARTALTAYANGQNLQVGIQHNSIDYAVGYVRIEVTQSTSVAASGSFIIRAVAGDTLRFRGISSVNATLTDFRGTIKRISN